MAIVRNPVPDCSVAPRKAFGHSLAPITRVVLQSAWEKSASAIWLRFWLEAREGIGFVGAMSQAGATPRCRNCDHPMGDGKYCPACGQRDLDFKRDWKGLMAEYASSMFHIDGKVQRGVLNVLFRPGKITADFLRGKRASQIPPVRLYLFSSLIFFIWLSATENVQIDNVGPEQIRSDESVPEGEEFATKLAKKFERPESIIAEFNVWLPRVFLLGVPLLALATRIVFWRRDLVYLEHLFVSMHLQSFLLLWVLLIALLRFLIGKVWPWSAGFFVELAALWIVLYPVFAVRRLFGFGWWRATFSALALELVFSLMVLGGVVGVAALAVLLA